MYMYLTRTISIIFEMTDLRVKVRICFGSVFLLLSCLPCTAKPIPRERTEADRKCLSLGADYVFDVGVQTCVSCTTCYCDFIAGNAHCVKCLEYGVLHCQTTDAVPPSPITTQDSSTLQQETTDYPATEHPKQTSTHTTTTSMPNQDEPWRIVVGLVVSSFVVMLIIAAVVLYKYRKRCFPKTNNATIRQDTQPPEASHPMIHSKLAAEQQEQENLYTE